MPPMRWYNRQVEQIGDHQRPTSTYNTYSVLSACSPDRILLQEVHACRRSDPHLRYRANRFFAWTVKESGHEE